MRPRTFLIGLVCSTALWCAPTSSYAAAGCPGDDDFQSRSTAITAAMGPSLTMVARSKINHLFSHPNCQGVVWAKVTLLGVNVNCTLTGGMYHTTENNTEQVTSTICNNIPCGYLYFAGGQHWWQFDPPDPDRGYTRPVDYSWPCPISEEEECDRQGGWWNCEGYCRCEVPNCPLIADLRNDGLALTDGPNGVDFDLRPDGVLERLAWTRPGIDDDAFVVLDRNGNGIVDSGLELFSNFASRPPGARPNGFSALSLFDQEDYGGNADGVISSSDAVFRWLQLWTDINHDGVSQQWELRPLNTALSQLNLQYRETGRRDRYGNAFRFLATANGVRPPIQRWIYDVFLVK